MTVTLNLPSDVEDRLRARAAAEGVAPEALLLRVITDSHQLQPDPMAGLGSLSEAELHTRLDLGFSPETWKRYRELIGKRQDEVLTDAEYAEMMTLIERLEDANARRLAAAVELARRSGEPFDELWKRLGLGPVAGDYDE